MNVVTTQKESPMATVVAEMSMSLDGFVADASDGIEQVFGWYGSGDVSVPTANPQYSFQVSEASARELREALSNVGALISGRRTFDLAEGWGGHHPMGVPVFVVTHSIPEGWPREDSSITFVTDGVESALDQARAVAGDKVVGVASPNVAQQLLNAGLLDAVRVSLVPVLLGEGVRFFDNLSGAPVQLEGPSVVEGTGVTHLYYRVR
jgi:dihydrofolate reductase